MRSNSLSINFVSTVTNFSRIVGFISLSNSWAFELMNRFSAASRIGTIGRIEMAYLCRLSDCALTNNGISISDIIDAHLDLPHREVHLYSLDIHKGKTVIGGLRRRLEVHLGFDTLWKYRLEACIRISCSKPINFHNV